MPINFSNKIGGKKKYYFSLLITNPFSLSSYYCIFELTTSQNQIKMKKKHLLLAAFAATMLAPTIAWAQYPQISGEAKENYTKMMTEERRRSDEAWAKALPIVQKKQEKDRPYIPWAGRPYDFATG